MRAAWLLVGGLALAGAAAPAADDDWIPLETADGVRVWHKAVPGSEVLAFRGAATVDVPLARLVGVLARAGGGEDWVDRLAESRVLREIGEGRVLLYHRYDLTWPVQDRDYVLERALELDPTRKVVTATARSVEDPAVPPLECCVRALTDPTVWRFTQLAPGRTAVEVEVFTDPRGSLPPWLVNAFQRQWPKNSILNLTARARRPDAPAYPPVAGW